MLQKFGLFATGLALTASTSFGAVTQDADAVKTLIDKIQENGEKIFDATVPVVVAVVALGILIAMVKKIKKS